MWALPHQTSYPRLRTAHISTRFTSDTRPPNNRTRGSTAVQTDSNSVKNDSILRKISNNYSSDENSGQVMANSSSGGTSSSSQSSAAVQPMSGRTLRPHSTPATLIWLEDNYELAEGVCIPRSVLYLHYVDFCANNSVQPVNAASFGKVNKN